MGRSSTCPSLASVERERKQTFHELCLCVVKIALIVLEREATARQGDLCLLTIRYVEIVDELCPIIGIQAQQRKRKQLVCLLCSSKHRFSTLTEQWEALRPTCGNISQCQGKEVVPPTEEPQCATRSTSANSGTCSSHCSNVRRGMLLFSKVPARVVHKPRISCCRCGRRRRSAVTTLIESKRVRHSGMRWRCSCRSKESRNIDKDGMSRLLHRRFVLVQISTNASSTIVHTTFSQNVFIWIVHIWIICYNKQARGREAKRIPFHSYLSR